MKKNSLQKLDCVQKWLGGSRDRIDSVWSQNLKGRCFISKVANCLDIKLRVLNFMCVGDDCSNNSIDRRSFLASAAATVTTLSLLQVQTAN